MKSFFILVILLFQSVFVYCASVTIYNDNFALIKDTKNFNIKKGQQKIEINDVASKIDPTSVLPKFISNSNEIAILEQNYNYDLVNSNKLLEKYIGSDIFIERYLPNSNKEKISGTLLYVHGEIIIKTKDDRIVINPQGEIVLPKMQEGLMLKPTLSWLIDSKVSGKKELELTYKTTGFSWIADYVAVLDKDDKNIDLTAWVTINNASGATYNNAKLKLISGDVNTIKEVNNTSERRLMLAKNVAVTEDSASGFQEKSFFEYHIYELSRTTNLKNNEKKQIEFVSIKNVPAEKKYVYESSKNDKVVVKLEIRNNKKSKLGIPLPKGKVRVFKNDGDNLELVGEDKMNHTAENEDVSLMLGNAFDITAQKIRTNSVSNSSSKKSEESFEITLKNAKLEPVKVNVIESFYGWSNWKITDSSLEYNKKNSNQICFVVEIPAKSEKKVTYKVKYLW